MSDNQTIETYVQKATESLAGAESECDNRRFNNCANRAYYAAFQAAIAALLREGVRASKDRWGHGFVQSQFVGLVVNRRHGYPSTLRSILTDLQLLRQRADYRTDLITLVEATRGLRRSREFVEAIRQEGERR